MSHIVRRMMDEAEHSETIGRCAAADLLRDGADVIAEMQDAIEGLLAECLEHDRDYEHLTNPDVREAARAVLIRINTGG